MKVTVVSLYVCFKVLFRAWLGWLYDIDSNELNKVHNNFHRFHSMHIPYGFCGIETLNAHT